MPEPEKIRACEVADGALIIVNNTPVKLIKGGRLPLIDQDGTRTNLYVVRSEADDVTTYIHPAAVVDVIWEPSPTKVKPGG